MHMIFKPKDIRKSCADINGDGNVTITDLMRLLNYVRWKKRNFIILNNFKELYAEIL